MVRGHDFCRMLQLFVDLAVNMRADLFQQITDLTKIKREYNSMKMKPSTNRLTADSSILS
jgi:hypothetical protein